MPRREYYQSHKERCREVALNYWRKYGDKYKDQKRIYARQHIVTTTKGVRYYGLNKRARPDGICEICQGKTVRLDYHHWDDSNVNLGLWVCKRCHVLCGGVEKGFDKIYLKLKDEISR